MKLSRRALFFLLFFTGMAILIILLMQPFLILHFREYIAVLFPKGIIALEERNLLFIIQGLMLLVIIPVYILTFIFSWKYRATNPKGTYDPDLVDNMIAEVIWWGLPLVMVVIVSILTLIKTYQLDPYTPIESNKKQLTIQVIALQWKWLFIYPEEKIASLNFLQLPKDTPIHFEITSDAPMNSFWIPKLGGQIYAMPGMKTELHLIANETGNFTGSSANLSGEGFAGMHFVTRSSSEEDYLAWVESAKQSPNHLDLKAYDELALPSQGNAPMLYQLVDETLFNQSIDKYLYPKAQ